MSGALTVESLRVILGRDVEELHLTVAKSSVLGLDSEMIANTLGVPRADLDDLMETQDYKDIRLLVGAEQAKDRVERDTSYDTLENIGLKKLIRRAELESDTDTLLRIVAVANRATRRVAPQKDAPLDPSQAGARVPLTLTKRFTEKLNGTERTETIIGSPEDIVKLVQSRHISVLDGSAVNPNFSEVKDLLQGVDKFPGKPMGFDSKKLPPAEKDNRSVESVQERQAVVDEDTSLESLKELAWRMRSNA